MNTPVLGRAQFLKTVAASAACAAATLTGCASQPAQHQQTAAQQSTSTQPAEQPAEKSYPSGKVVATSMYSPALGIDWNYDVYEPEGYDQTAAQTYPVIYLLHGLYGNHRNLLERFDSKAMLDKAMAETGNKALVVFVDGFNSWYINAVGGLKMEDALINDLIPFIESTYHASSKPEERAIGGISMGGFGAARLALKYPTVFSKAVLVSPAVWQRLAEDNVFYKSLHAFSDGTTSWSWQVYDSVHPAAYLSNAAKVTFYVSTTADDTTVPKQEVDTLVKQLKDAGSSVTYQEETGDGHNWKFWGRVAPDAYEWLLQNL